MSTPRSGGRRGARALVAALAIATITSPSAAGATSAQARPLAVSVPASAIVAAPGTTMTVPVRVSNPGTNPISVTVAGRGLILGDDGHVAMATGPDPLWSSRTEFPARLETIRPQSYLQISVRVRVPAMLAPDLYFIGFVVTPRPDVSADLRYVNQIGSYLTIDVPGPRDRQVAADLSASGFTTSSSVHGTLRVHNVGHAAAVFWGENDVTSKPNGHGAQNRIDRSLLPTGTSRVFIVEGHANFPISIVTLTAHIIYPGRTDASTRELIIRKQIIVVEPIAMVAIMLILFGLLLWVAYHLRSRHRKRQTRSPQQKVAELRATVRQLERHLAGGGS